MKSPPTHLIKSPPIFNIRGAVIPQRSAFIPGSTNSMFEQTLKVEQSIMRNPLSRGMGIKGVKMTKTLLGTPSILNVIEAAGQHKLSKHQHVRSPERGFGHVLKEGRLERQEILISSKVGPTPPYLLTLTKIESVLLPCLCIGGAAFFTAFPDVNLPHLFNHLLGGTEALKGTVSGSGEETNIWLEYAQAKMREASSEVVAELVKTESVSEALLKQNEKQSQFGSVLVGAIILAVMLSGVAAKAAYS